MVTVKVISEGESIPLKVPDEMLTATDEQILSFVSETLKKDFTRDEYTVERTPQAILVHPKARYG